MRSSRPQALRKIAFQSIALATYLALGSHEVVRIYMVTDDPHWMGTCVPLSR